MSELKGEFMNKEGERVTIFEMPKEREDAPETFYFICKDGIVADRNITHEQMQEYITKNKVE